MISYLLFGKLKSAHFGVFRELLLRTFERILALVDERSEQLQEITDLMQHFIMQLLNFYYVL